MIVKDWGASLGQHFFMGLSGLSLTHEERKTITQRELGGVILFKRNIADREQLQELCRELSSLERDSSSHIPLFISVDMEGGRVARLKAPFPLWPALGSLAKSTGLEDFFSERSLAGQTPAKIFEDPAGAGMLKETQQRAYAYANSMGIELSSLGFNLDFAPVLDVFTNPKNQIIGDRAISQHVDIVVQVAPSLIRGYKDARIMTCGKHLPGHGNTLLDSHFDLPIEHDTTWAMLKTRELRPFQAAMQNDISMLMMAHILYPEVDTEEPATTSKKIIGQLVRGDLGYQGVITTDDLDMKALANRYSSAERAVKALSAGNDILLFCNEPESFELAFEGVKKFAVDGVFGPEKFAAQENDKSIRRLLYLKKRP